MGFKFETIDNPLISVVRENETLKRALEILTKEQEKRKSIDADDEDEE